MSDITIAGNTYNNVPAIEIPKSGGGTAKFYDTSNADGIASQVLNNQIVYGADGQITGSMPNLGTIGDSISDKDQRVTTGAGYVGGISVGIKSTEKAKIIPENIKSGVTILGVEGSLSSAWDWRGTNVEVLDSALYSDTDTLDNTDYATWTPSTSAKVIVSTVSLSGRSLDMKNYDYLIRWQFTMDVSYASGTTMKLTPIRQVIDSWQALFRRPSNLTNLQSNTKNGNVCDTLLSAPILEYNNSSGKLTMTYNGSYCFYTTLATATFSSATANTPMVTIKTPAIYARCYSSYFSTASASAVDQANSTYKLKGTLYRTSPGSTIEAIFAGAVDLFNNPI